MTDLPAPLTPPDCDLRGLEWMPLYGDRLFESETWLLASPEGRCAALALWWAAWKQRPAGSVPRDVRVLSHLAGYGRDVQAWSGVQLESLRGWVECSDERLYHPIVCELALEAWERRQRERDRKANYRAGRDSKKSNDVASNVPRDTTRTRRGQDEDMTRTETGTVPRTGTGTVPLPSPSRPAAVPGDRTGQDSSKKESVATLLLDVQSDSNQSASLSKSSKPESAGSDDPGFEAFWSAYPRREGKGQARRAWGAAVRKVTPEAILAGLSRATFSNDPKFRPLPATWLNGERWLDQQPTSDAPPDPTNPQAGENGSVPAPSDDPWGADAWALRAAKGETDTDAGQRVPAINGSLAAKLARAICEMAGIPPSARPRLDALEAWCRDDVWLPHGPDPYDVQHGADRTDAIFAAIRRQATRMHERGETITSLAVFETAVRQASASKPWRRPVPAEDEVEWGA